MEQGRKRVLVSGGAGYIGSHVSVELIEAGYDVVVADNLSNCDLTCFEGVKRITGRKDLPFVEMDFCDREAADRLFSDFRMDAVIHFAAFKAVGESVAEPVKYYRNNLTSFLNVIEAARNHGGCNVLFSSSATVYGEPEELPVTERSPRQSATSPYGNTKQICEDILRDAVKAYAGDAASAGAAGDVVKANAGDAASAGMTGAAVKAYAGDAASAGAAGKGPIRGIALRYFNPIGAHPSALIGELPRGVPNNLVPFITQTAIGKRDCLSIFGNDYPTEDGTCKRDYIDVVDLAKAHVCAIRRMLEGKMEQDYEVFNVGTGRPLSVLELVRAFEEVNGLRLNYRFAPRRAGDVVAIWADPSLANRKLGWRAERTTAQTLASAWAWERHLAGK